MPASLLWVNKDQLSTTLSNSSRAEEARIRRHVQTKPKLAKKYDWSQTARVVRPFIDRGLPSVLSLMLDAPALRGLEYFKSKTARDWSGWQDSFFWNALAPRACNDDVGIAHGLAALGALHEASKNLLDPDQCGFLHRLARTEWSKSVNVVRAADVSYPRALISCIVLASAQDILNSHESFRLVRSGQALLQEMESHLGSSLQRPTMSEKMMIDTHIRPVFDRLNSRLCTIGGMTGPIVISARKHGSTTTIGNQPVIPQCYKSVRDARNKLVEILRWGHDNVNLASSTFLGFEQFKLQLREMLATWTTALELVTDLELAIDEQSRCKKLLQLASMTGRILLETFDTKTEMVYDNYIGEFWEMIQMIRDIDILRSLTQDRVFGIDSGLIDIIAYIGMKCRDPVVRRWAIHFLLDTYRFEGDRISSFGGMAIRELMSLEESENTRVNKCEDVPESQRRRLVGGYKYRRYGERRIVFVKTPYDVAGGSPLEESTMWEDGDLRRRPIGKLTDAIEPDYPPEVYFEPGHAAFLEDAATKTYCQFKMERFYFPMPRV